MASMSRNSSSSSLMGFSVHQPAIGASLQFFPAMGTKQLDDMINAYVPGSASILDKRAAVSLEFFEHTIQTGELFKFFLVYPARGSVSASPASSSAMHDSGYGSSFNTSPVMSEGQWAASFESSSSKKAASPVSNAQASDFSHLPGMKIMTKDGRDVTNSASRGCKTKEQREHAHLMRIMKACESCKRKKTRCDPSHKRTSADTASPAPKAHKKAKTLVPSSPPTFSSSAARNGLSNTIPPPFDPTISELLALDINYSSTQAPVENWEQFIQYDEELPEFVHNDYDFFFDPAGYFSPTSSNSASASPSQVFTPAKSKSASPIDVEMSSGVEHTASGLYAMGETQLLNLPYLAQEGAEHGNNYVDFALYSPGSSCLDEDLAVDIATPSGSGIFGSSREQQRFDRSRRTSQTLLTEGVISPSQLSISSSDEPSAVISADELEHHISPDVRIPPEQADVRGRAYHSRSREVDRCGDTSQRLSYAASGAESHLVTLPGSRKSHVPSDLSSPISRNQTSAQGQLAFQVLSTPVISSATVTARSGSASSMLAMTSSGPAMIASLGGSIPIPVHGGSEHSPVQSGQPVLQTIQPGTHDMMDYQRLYRTSLLHNPGRSSDVIGKVATIPSSSSVTVLGSSGVSQASSPALRAFYSVASPELSDHCLNHAVGIPQRTGGLHNRVSVAFQTLAASENHNERRLGGEFTTPMAGTSVDVSGTHLSVTALGSLSRPSTSRGESGYAPIEIQAPRERPIDDRHVSHTLLIACVIFAGLAAALLMAPWVLSRCRPLANMSLATLGLIASVEACQHKPAHHSNISQALSSARYMSDKIAGAFKLKLSESHSEVLRISHLRLPLGACRRSPKLLNICQAQALV
ncbi:hypothetical protein BX600DRAFT_113649 [Xylariales sp. PMI_506]|nr:hypothetical protein BX600DRAFT_113649 [Xylariales sp. PMI_506]